MPQPWRITYAGALCHVTSRGNGRQRVFLCDDDYERFLDQMDAALAKDEVTLYAYVLMPNHYHLLVKTPLTGKRQREVGRYYGYGRESAVGKQRKLLAGLAAADARLAK